MQISITRDSYHIKTPWLVVLPARLSSTGKRQYKRFSTRAAASDYLAAVRAHVRSNGEKPLSMLPAALAADAAAAFSLLEGTGLSLCDAVRHCLSAIQSQAVAYRHILKSGGAGEQVANPSPTAAPLVTLSGILDTLEASKSHQSAATIRNRRSSIQALIRKNPHLEQSHLEHITTEQLHAALDTAWPDAAQAWNSARRALHALYNYAIRRRIIRCENPVTPIDQRHTTEAEIFALPPSDLRALFAAARPPLKTDWKLARPLSPAHHKAMLADLTYLRPYIAICALAGIRPTECTRMRWQDVDFEENIISVRRANSKTGGQRHIPMAPTLRAWLISCKPASAAPSDLITAAEQLPARLAALRRRAGFNAEKPWQNDCLRHSYATYYLKSQCGTIEQLQLNMGHRSAQLLYTRYTNMAGVTRQMAEEWWSISPSCIFQEQNHQPTIRRSQN